MHELSIAKSMVELVLARVDASVVKKVNVININMGQMYDYDEKYLTEYIQELGEGTVLSESVVKLHILPITFKCKSCGEIFADEEGSPVLLKCPKCGSASFAFNSGKEMDIASIEVEEY